MESVPCKIYGSQFANEIKRGKPFHIPVFSYKTFSSLGSYHFLAHGGVVETG